MPVSTRVPTEWVLPVPVGPSRRTFTPGNRELSGVGVDVSCVADCAMVEWLAWACGCAFKSELLFVQGKGDAEGWLAEVALGNADVEEAVEYMPLSLPPTEPIAR